MLRSCCSGPVHLLEMNGESYRLKRRRETAAPQASGEPCDVQLTLTLSPLAPRTVNTTPAYGPRHRAGGTPFLRPSCRSSAEMSSLTGQQKCHIQLMENVALTPKEQTRLQVLNSLLAEHMTLDQAAALMGVSPLHTRRILVDYGKPALHPLPMAIGAASRPTLFPRRSGAG